MDVPGSPALTSELIQARAPGRRMSAVTAPSVPDAVLDRQLRAVLAERTGPGLWVFAYGALLWEREFAFDEERIGGVHGMIRRYCVWDNRNRGTPERPSLTQGLEAGAGSCSGAVLHLPEDGLDAAFRTVWQHEMPPGYYEARWLEVETGAGPVSAVSFVANPLHPLYAGAMPAERVADILATTAGPGGPAAEYLLNTAEWLRAHGERDDGLERLCATVAERLAG